MFEIIKNGHCTIKSDNKQVFIGKNQLEYFKSKLKKCEGGEINGNKNTVPLKIDKKATQATIIKAEHSVTLHEDKMPALARCIEELYKHKDIVKCNFNVDNGSYKIYNKNNEEVYKVQGEAECSNNYIIETIENEIFKSKGPEPLDSSVKLNLSDGFPLNVIFSGPPGTGKTFAAKGLLEEIKKDNHYAEVCFHPAMAYEDFVRAMEPEGQNNFISKNKVFGQICDDALADPDNLYAILIDEINRANLPAVLGELMSALEYRGDPYHVANAVPYNNSKRYESQLIVPKNLLIIGTMNTADRSTGILDYALRRRFAFFHFKPNLDLVSGDVNTEGSAKNIFIKVLELFYQDPNKDSVRSAYLAPDIEPDDVAIGHSYFLGNKTWKFKAKYQVAPILEEYLRDGVLIEEKDTNGNYAVQAVINEIKKL